jgi:hypothetical protein
MPNKCSKNLHIQVASVHYLFMYFHNKDDMGAMVGRGSLVPVEPLVSGGITNRDWGGGTPTPAPTPFIPTETKGSYFSFFSVFNLSVYSDCCLTRICAYTYLNLYICIYLSIYTIYAVRLDLYINSTLYIYIYKLINVYTHNNLYTWK